RLSVPGWVAWKTRAAYSKRRTRRPSTAGGWQPAPAASGRPPRRVAGLADHVARGGGCAWTAGRVVALERVNGDVGRAGRDSPASGLPSRERAGAAPLSGAQPHPLRRRAARV